MQRFLRERMELVRALTSTALPVTYADMALITCGVLSACAARRWPSEDKREKIDRRRFVELLVMHSPSDFHTDWISVPMLLNEGAIVEADTPYEAGSQTRIFRDEEIDLTFERAAARYPNVERRALIECCYAYLIYERLRCGYAHEYCPGEYVTDVQASRRDARVSYISRHIGLCPTSVRRTASFNILYLIELADYHVGILPNAPCQRPSTWWLDAMRGSGRPEQRRPPGGPRP